MTEATTYRTHTCGSLRLEDEGSEVRLAGWVHARREHRNIMFLDLRDRYGMTQIVVSGDTRCVPAATNLALDGRLIGAELHDEDVLLVEGKVVRRPEQLVNPHLETGMVEIQAASIRVFSTAKTPPFDLTRDGDVGEDIRLAYRYLDLRRSRLQENMMFRDRFLMEIRRALHDEGFLEVETPILTKSTPEGARDFIVPARLHPGMFYALPQSPQQYKQLLMVAGFDRYFQIARCFRDEDQRGDRQPEFTQLDMEMSFVEREDVLRLTEAIFALTLDRLHIPIARTPFPRLTHAEAMAQYGSDKPDIRSKAEKDAGALGFCWIVDFPLFESELEAGHYAPSHHMFTAPHPEDRHLLTTNPSMVRSTQYDLACNGHEVAGGSIRIHERVLQETVFDLVGLTAAHAREQFRHLLEAFEFGVPPHGGIASGIERLLMVIRGEPSVREVMAFPKNQKAEDVLFHAPSPVDPAQLEELHLRINLPPA